MRTSRFEGELIRPFGTDTAFDLGEMRGEASTALRVISALRRHSLFTGAVVVLLLTGTLCITVGTGLGLASFRDVAYPDSATLLKIREFVRSGHMYSDINRPPYHLALYGPLTYVLLAIPYGLAQSLGVSPQIFVRLGIIGALSCCVLLIFLVSKRLFSSRPIAWLSVVFSLSALPLAIWTAQIRGDFLGLAFSLLAIYLFLLKEGRPQSIGAAISAGIAVLVKQTFLAVPIAIICWLAYSRKYKQAAAWALCFAFTVAGGYGIVWLREPLLVQHLAAVRHPIFEYRYALAIIWHAVAQPVTPFAVLGGALVLRKRIPEQVFLVIYCVVAWGMAILTIPQVGGNINYFWEPLLASAVLAGLGLYELQRKQDQTPLLVTAMLVFLLLRASLPMLRQELDYLGKCYTNFSDFQARKTKWEAFASAVSGRRLLSTIPDVTALSTIPEIPDPYLNATLELRGQWNSAPVLAQMDADVFDLIVVDKGEAQFENGDFRGVRSWSDAMWSTLKRTYAPVCVFEDMEVWLPHRASGDILPKLEAIGCAAEAKPPAVDSQVKLVQ